MQPYAAPAQPLGRWAGITKSCQRLGLELVVVLCQLADVSALRLHTSHSAKNEGGESRQAGLGGDSSTARLTCRHTRLPAPAHPNPAHLRLVPGGGAEGFSLQRRPPRAPHHAPPDAVARKERDIG